MLLVAVEGCTHVIFLAGFIVCGGGENMQYVCTPGVLWIDLDLLPFNASWVFTIQSLYGPSSRLVL